MSYINVQYVWGKSERQAIKCQDQDASIIGSLAQALRHLRHPKVARLLWADGPCINQHDLFEKGHQVQRMGEIFAKAENVIIWLGADTEDEQIKTAMRVVRYIIDKIPHPGDGPIADLRPDDPTLETLDEQ
jgi:hypothetical protein